MPKRLPDAKRAAIAKDIKAGGKRNEIARKHSVSASTVTGIAREASLGSAFDRSMTVTATRAREADCKAMRVQLKADLLADAQRLRRRAWSKYKIAVPGPEGAEIVTLDLPPLPDVRAAYAAIGTCTDKSLRLEQHDSDGNADHAKSMLGRLFTGLALAVEGDTQETPADDG